MQPERYALSAFEGITAALTSRGSKQAGNVWQCPAHPDENPSLSVTQADGKVLVHCHAGCTAEEIMAALDLEPAALYDGYWRRNGNGPSEPAEGVTLARLAQAWRIPRKTLERVGWTDAIYNAKPVVAFPVWNPDSTVRHTRYRVADGGYRQEAGSSTFLYGAPWIAQARDNHVPLFLVEGEHDALTLFNAGHFAVGIPGVNNWRDDYVALFDDVPEIIAAFDADEAGEKLRAKIAESPLRERIRVLQLPPGAKDISDVYLANPDGFAVWLSSQTPVPLATSYGLADKLKPLAVEFERGVPVPDYSLEGLFAPGTLTYVGGNIGAGKTPTMLRAVRSVLTRDDFLSFKHRGIPDGYRVVYLTQEGEASFLPAAAEAGLQDVADRFDVGYIHDFAMDDFARTVEDVARKLAASGGGLLVVDTALDWTRARDENDAAVMTAALAPLVTAVQKYRIGGLAIGHSVKSLDDVEDAEADVRHIRGSGAVVSNASIVYVLKKAKPRQDGGVRCFKRVRTRLATSAPERTYTIVEAGRMREVLIVEQFTRQDGSLQDRILDKLADGPVERRALLRTLKVKSSELDYAVEDLEQRGLVQRSGSGKTKDPVVLEKVSPKGVTGEDVSP